MDSEVLVDCEVEEVLVETDVLVDVELVEVLAEVEVEEDVELVEVVNACWPGVKLICANPVDIWAVTNLS